MAEVTAQMVKELRERTQAGMSDCKSALVEAQGDMEKAVEVILKKGLAKSAKRAGAVAAEGEVRSLVAADGRSGVLVEVNIQTDFAARNDKFRTFVEHIATVASQATEGASLDTAIYPGTSRTVAEVRDELIATIGENISIRRWAKASLKAPTGLVHAYVHLGGKIGVLLEITSGNAQAAQHPEFKKFADDVAMQIAAMNPSFLTRKEVPEGDIAKQREIYAAQLKDEKKPEAAWPKIIDGKLGKWYTEICLVDQDSVIVQGSTIDQVRAKLAVDLGTSVEFTRFVRFERGEGIEKKQDDFAAEVAKMAGN